MAIVKIVHIFSLFLWIGSFFCLSWFLARQDLCKTFRRYYLFVELPAMVIAIASGLTLWSQTRVIAPWFHVKATFALLLVFLDLFFGRALCKPYSKLKFMIIHVILVLFLLAILFSIYYLKFAWQK